MLKFRLIAFLHIRNGNLIKPINCEGVRKLGEPHDFAKRYEAAGIDELVYLDCVASLYGRNLLADLVNRAAGELATPLTVGGGIRHIEDGLDLLLSGADKVAINTGAIERPELITEIAHKFGSQAMVVQIDAKRKGSGWEAFTHGGRQTTGRDAVAWADEAVSRGAGEILLTSIDQEGTGRGYDQDLLRAVCDRVRVPVIAAGGLGCARHAIEAARAGASGVAMAGALHYGRVSLNEIRTALDQAGVPVRMAA